MTQNLPQPPGDWPVDDTVSITDPPRTPVTPDPPDIPPGPADPADVSPPDGGRHRAWRFFFGALTVFLGGAVLIETVLWVQSIFVRSEALGYAISGLGLMVLLAGVHGVRREWRQIKRLASTETLRAEAAAMLRSKSSYGHAKPFLDRLSRQMPMPVALDEKMKSLERTIQDTHTDLEILTLFDRDILRPLDENAQEIIIRNATRTALGVSLSPAPALDVVIVLARSAQMIREIAEVYGFQPGWIATLKLARQAFTGSVSIAAIDVMGTVWGEHLGSRLAGFLSASLSQGVLGAVRMARLGIAVAEQCRPVSSLGDQETPMKIISRRVLALVTGPSARG